MTNETNQTPVAEEQEGWNCEHLVPGGRNVYIFRDTNHMSPVIQDNLTEAIDRAISEKQFKLLFIEGYDGVFTSPYPTCLPNFLVEKLMNGHQTYNPAQRIAYQLKRKRDLETQVIGVDNSVLFNEHLSCFTELFKLLDTTQIEDPTRLPIMQEINARTKRLTDARTCYSAGAIIRIMDEQKANAAGVIYGDGHYALLTDILGENDLGYASYYPGFKESETKDYDNYCKKVVEMGGRVKSEEKK